MFASNTEYLELGRLVLVVLGSEVPVGHLGEEVLNEVGATVLVVEVVGVLPNIDGEDGLEAVSEGSISIVCADDLELLVLVESEPSPTGTEVGSSGLLELLTESGEGAEVAVNGLTEDASGLATTVGLEGVPEEAVVEVLGSVVEDRTRLALEDDLLESLALELGT